MCEPEPTELERLAMENSDEIERLTADVANQFAVNKIRFAYSKLKEMGP